MLRKTARKKTVPAPEKTPHPFDVKTIETLVSLMAENDLSEIDLHHEASRIRLRRGPTTPVVTATMPAIPAVAAVNSALTPVAHAQSVHAPGSHAAHLDKKIHLIKSPTPGTFYAQASPGEPPYVKVGSKVTPDSVVCKIEAMKIFNDIMAECTGIITEILVQNQEAVDYGQPLFKVEMT